MRCPVCRGDIESSTGTIICSDCTERAIENVAECQHEHNRTIWDRMSDPAHPIWPWSRLLVLTVAVTIIAAVNARDFDETEYKLIGQLITVFGVYEGGARLLFKK